MALRRAGSSNGGRRVPGGHRSLLVRLRGHATPRVTRLRSLAMRIGYTAALCLAITVSVFGQTPSASRAREFRIDAGHSTIEFDIPFMYSRVRGRFDDVRGTILLPDSSMGKIADAGAMAVIRVASVNTGSAHRDEHLRSSDFFDADRFPLIVFRATRVIGTMH